MLRIHHLTGALALLATLAAADDAQAQCASNADCRAGRVCTKSGECVARTCSKDVDCPDNGTCEAGVCKAATQSTAPVAEHAPALVPRYRTERTVGMPALWATGIALFGTAWIATIGVTAGVSAEPDKGKAVGFASIPVFGPWVMLGSDLDTHSYTAPLVVSGVLQSAGLALTITGFIVRREHTVPVWSLGTRPDAPTVSLLPTPGGAAVVGAF